MVAKRVQASLCRSPGSASPEILVPEGLLLLNERGLLCEEMGGRDGLMTNCAIDPSSANGAPITPNAGSPIWAAAAELWAQGSGKRLGTFLQESDLLMEGP